MTITYGRVYDEGLRMEVTEARYKGVIMKLERIKTNLQWTPLDNDPSVAAIHELIKGME